MALRGFLFDLDGTLVDCERETEEALARVLAEEANIVIDDRMRAYVVGRSWTAIHQELHRRYPLGWPLADLVARVAARREQVFAEVGMRVLPGVAAVLRWTREAPRALVTGSSRREVATVLPRLGPDATFAAVFAAEDTPRSKPAPDGYLAAAEALGLAPGDCLVVEDSVAGIAAGIAAGCVVLAVRAGNFGGWDQSAAHRVVDTLDELTPALVEALARDYGSRA